MQLTIEYSDGWMYVRIGKETPWHKGNFFALVDDWYDQIKEAYEKESRPVVFDLTRLPHVDSILTSLVIRTVRLADGRRNAMIAPTEEVRGIMTLLGIDRLIEVFTSFDEWHQAMGQS